MFNNSNYLPILGIYLLLLQKSLKVLNNKVVKELLILITKSEKNLIMFLVKRSETLSFSVMGKECNKNDKLA